MITAADVIVVGAGLAGLTAARAVANAGRTVIVLEARDRVGGRVVGHPIGDGKVIEMGGEYAGPTQDRILAVAGELGVSTFPPMTTASRCCTSAGNAALTPVSFPGSAR
jgi:monoamine oxidase